jgi:formylmethanofuran dehydrogenase subunit C
MTRWQFRRRDGDQQSIDASSIRRSSMVGKSRSAIESIQLVADGTPVDLVDLFDLTVDDFEPDLIVVQGDLANVHGLGAKHDKGEFQVTGTVGDSLACGMVGGRIMVDGDAGAFVGGPIASHASGMSGGVVIINGSVGAYAGHRMRRGTLMVQGDAGAMLAASMVAGTICIGGVVGNQMAVAMRRGSIVLANGASLVQQADVTSETKGSAAVGRFSSPTRFDPAFLTLYADPLFRDLTRSLGQLPVFRTRADRNVGGLGEIIFPATAELVLEK